MNGLQNFVQSKQPRSGSPAIAQQQRLSRQEAASLKIPLNKRGMSVSSSKKLPIAAPQPVGFASNGYTDRNTYSNQQYIQEPETWQAQPAQVQEHGFFEDTINSDFDKTITDRSYNGSQEYQQDGQDGYDQRQMGTQVDEHANIYSRQGYPQQILNHKPSQAHLASQAHSPSLSDQRQIESPTRPQAAVNNRFANPHRDLEVRTIHKEPSTEYETQVTRKRSRSAERKPASSDYDLPPTGHLAVDDQQSDREPESSTPTVPTHGKGRSSSKLRSTSQIRSSSQKPHSQEAALSVRDHDGQDESFDYTDEELKSMKYSKLAKESWESIPQSNKFTLPPELRKSNISLEKKIEYYIQHEKKLKIKFKNSPNGIQDDEAPNFFSQLSTREWDEAGDIFITKFTEIMNQLRNKRAEKRKVTTKFEKEIQRREKAVRGKSENLDRKFAGMRQSGEDMLNMKMR